MATSKPANDKEFELIKEGTYQAVCIANWDIGLQKTTWNGEEKMNYKMVLQWELNAKNSDGFNFILSKMYTNSLGKKANMRKDLDSWGIKITETHEKIGIDLDILIGKNCFLTIAHSESKGNTYANIVGISGLPEGVQELTTYKILKDEPEWIKKKRIANIPDEIAQKTANPVTQLRAGSSEEGVVDSPVPQPEEVKDADAPF